MTRTHVAKSRLLARTALAAALIAPASAFAQDNQTLPPSLDNFSLQPGQNQAQPTPPVVVPTVPRETPAPTPAPTPPRASSTPTPAPTPTPAEDAEEENPAPAPAETGNNIADPLPAPEILEDELLPAPPPAEPAPAETPPPATATPRDWTGWIVAALALLAALAALLFWRRRRGAGGGSYEEADRAIVFDEAPAVQADPVALAEQQAAPVEPAAPVDHVALADPAPADVAAATLPAAEPDGRPWIEFALRPVKAGVNVVDALVEFELTVGNAGSVAAEDVQVAAWLLSASPNQDAEIARFLQELPAEAAMVPFAVEPGDARRVDAAIALPRTGVNVVTARDRPFFVPLIIADARYRLPDGGEGRTSATFVVGTTRPGQEKLGPIWLDRGVRMHDNVEARLHGEPVRR